MEVLNVLSLFRVLIFSFLIFSGSANALSVQNVKIINEAETEKVDITAGELHVKATINNSSGPPVVSIGNASGSIIADVITEDGLDKLLVKATQVPEALGNLFFIHAIKGASSLLAVDGSVVSQTFSVNSDSSADLLVNGLIFEGFANGIKIDKFLSLNSPLTNGILIEVKSQDQVFQFLPIRNTIEFNSHFAYGSGRSFDLDFASGNDSIVARFGLDNPFIIKKIGTYATDDYIKVIIQDDISSINNLQFIAFGNKDF